MLFVICLSVINVRAEDVVPLEKDQKAPFTGILMTPSKAAELKNELLDKDMYKAQVDLYKANNGLLNDQVTLWRDQSQKLSKQLIEERSGFWTKAGFFLLGAAITTGLAFAVRGATK